MLQHPQFTLSILDPTSLLGSETVTLAAQAFPAARRRYFHTTGSDEHLITETSGHAALVPPLADGRGLEGSDVVVATATPTPVAAAVLVDWLRANPGVILLDGSQPGIVPDESAPVLLPPAPGTTEQRWFHLADPALSGPVKFVHALASIEPRELHITVLLPVSSFGELGVDELVKQAASRLSGRPPRKPEVLPAVLAFDAAPASAQRHESLSSQLTALLPGLATRLNAIEVGIFHGHTSVAAVRCDGPATIDHLAALLREQAGIRLPRRNERPQPSAVIGDDDILCAELRSSGGWVTAWLFADGLRVGGAQAIVDVLAAVRAS